MKWVDDFVIFREHLIPTRHLPKFYYNISNIFAITKPLCIPRHSIMKKGQDFTCIFDYVGFTWNIASKSVFVPTKKRLQALAKVHDTLLAPGPQHLRSAKLPPYMDLSNTSHLYIEMVIMPSLDSLHFCSQMTMPNSTCQLPPAIISCGGTPSSPFLTSCAPSPH